MGANAIYGSMLAGSVALMVLAAARRPEAPLAPPAPAHAHERPWLTPEAAAQIVGPDGSPGPLFAGVALGGPAPAPEVRARIADFARANGVDIRLEIAGGELEAIRFAVTYGGCCGYEGADALGRRLGRPRTSRCCGCEREWIDDWALALDDGVHVRGRVRVNRVEVRWEETATFAELLDRAETMLGKDRASVRAAAGDRWTELEFEHRYLVEVPYGLAAREYWGPAQPGDLGVELVVEHGRVAEISVAPRSREEGDGTPLADMMRARWGRPRVVSKEPEQWTWRKPDRTITADLDGDPTSIVIRAR